MKKWSFKERFQYGFDNLMSRGTVALIGLLFAITMFVVGVVGLAAALVGGEGGVGSQIWLSLMHALDAGTLAGDSLDNIPYIILMSLVTLCGLFITSILIGIITTGFEEKINQLRKGTSRVLEEGHTVILGFDENVYTLLESLIEANANQKDACIVVVGEEEKEVMEEEIAANISDFKTTRIVCRSGSLYKSHILGRCSLENCKSILINLYDDAQTIRTILAVSAYLDECQVENNKLYMTAVITDLQNVEAARIAGGNKLEVIFAKDAISRIIAHTCGEPGLSGVMLELFDYEGDEFYFEQIPELYGKTFREALNRFSNAVVFGIRKEDGKVVLKPAMDTVIEKGDRMILLEEDDGAYQQDGEKYSVKSEFLSEKVTGYDMVHKDLLILGCNSKLSNILKEYDNYVPTGTLVTVISMDECDLDDTELHNITLKHDKAEPADRMLLEAYMKERDWNVLILSDDNLDNQSADAKNLLQLIFLRDIMAKTNKSFSITSEMNKSENQRLASLNTAEDFVVGSNIVNLIMAQVSENRELMVLFDDILDEEGSEIYMKPVADYVKLNVPVDFYTITESAAGREEIAIGYKKLVDGKMVIVTNPRKSEAVTFQSGDDLIVIAEE